MKIESPARAGRLLHVVEINARLLSLLLWLSEGDATLCFLLAHYKCFLSIFSLPSKVSDLHWSHQTLPEMLQFARGRPLWAESQTLDTNEALHVAQHSVYIGQNSVLRVSRQNNNPPPAQIQCEQLIRLYTDLSDFSSTPVFFRCLHFIVTSARGNESLGPLCLQDQKRTQRKWSPCIEWRHWTSLNFNV